MPSSVQLGLWRKLSGVQRERAAAYLGVDAAVEAIGNEREWAVIGALAARIGDTGAAVAAVGDADAATALWVELAAGDAHSRSDALLGACASEEGRRAVVQMLGKLVRAVRWREKLVERVGIGASSRSDACLVRHVPVGLLWELCEPGAVLHRSAEVSDAALVELVAEPLAGRVAAGERASVDGAWKLAAIVARGVPGESSRELVERIAHEQIRKALRAWVEGWVWIAAPWSDTPIDAVAAACAWRWMATSETVAHAHDREIIEMLDGLADGALPLAQVLANPAWLPRQRAVLLRKLGARETAKVVQTLGAVTPEELTVAISTLLDDDEEPMAALAAGLYVAQPPAVRAELARELGAWRFEALGSANHAIREDLEVLVALPAQLAFDTGGAGALVAWASEQLGGDEDAWAALMAVLEANRGLSLADACAAARAAVG